MAQIPSPQVVEPFGEVNVWTQPDGSLRVKATILMTPAVEGAQTGLAIDGSASMKQMFGASAAVSALFAPSTPNVVEPVVKTIASYLANFDTDGNTTVIYWACGPGGINVEEIGDMDAATVKTKTFTAPKQFGTGTKLLPAVRYFTETKFPDAPWSIFIFITDGVIEDLAEVQDFSLKLAQQIASGQRQFVKLVLIGIGEEVDEGQMEALDDLDYGGLKSPDGQVIDLWDHKMAAEMQKIEEIFAEVVSSDMILAPSAEILDSAGNHATPNGVGSYSDGLPALLDFNVPAGTTEFTLVMPGGQKIVQSIVI
ncbi:MAG: VWA domain-containing protein [Pyrinomonadaceae bacterium]|nr:VWA domain-containing protein [Pyrinomonadaceae bacterium]